MTSTDGLRPLLAPRSIAVFGASENPAKISGVPLANLLASGFPGPVYALNASRSTVQGLRSYRKMAEIDGDVDCAIIAVGAAHTLDAVRQCAEKRVGAAVLLTSGFAELGEEGAALQTSIKEIAQKSGMRLLGPNTTGLIDYGRNLTLTFAPWKKLSVLDPIAIVSQSGGFASYVEEMAAMRSAAFTFSVATGNECDLECSDFISVLARREDIKVILLYLEGCRSGENLVASLDLARRNGKRVIALKSGTSELGARAAASHTAALSGSDAIYDLLFEELGVHRARSVEEMVDVARAITTCALPAGRRAAILTLSGAFGVHLADEASEAGFDLRPLPETAQAIIKQIAPMGAAQNPVDLTAQIHNDPEMLKKGLAAILETQEYDIVISGVGGNVKSGIGIGDAVTTALIEARQKYPNVVHAVSAWVPIDELQKFEHAGLYASQDAVRCIRTLRAATTLAEGGRPLAPPPKIAAPERGLRGTLNEQEAKHLLREIGIPSPREVFAARADDVVGAAEEVGYPVALKVVSRDLPHKTDVGGVKLNIGDREALRLAVESIIAGIGAQAPNTKIDGFLVSEMIFGRVECLLGLQNTGFGPAVVFGLGGTLVDINNVVSRRLAPVDIEESRKMIAETPAIKLLSGFRGQEPSDTDALARAIASLSRFAWEEKRTLVTLEINPLAVGKRGTGVIALDATAVFAV